MADEMGLGKTVRLLELNLITANSRSFNVLLYCGLF